MRGQLGAPVLVHFLLARFCLPGSRLSVRSWGQLGLACLSTKSAAFHWGALALRWEVSPSGWWEGPGPGCVPRPVPRPPFGTVSPWAQAGPSQMGADSRRFPEFSVHSALCLPEPQLLSPGSSRLLFLQPGNFLGQAGTTTGLTSFVHIVRGVFIC